MSDDQPTPAAASAPERDRAVLEQLAQLDDPADWHAALLALLLMPRSEHTLDGWQVWQDETLGNRQAQVLWNRIDGLSGVARLPCFEQLLGRVAGQPLIRRQMLLASARKVMRSRGTLRPLDRLHWLAMRFGLGETALFGAAAAAGATPAAAAAAELSDSSDLSALPGGDVQAVAGYSADLSRMVPVDAPRGSTAGAAWYADVLAPWSRRGMLPPWRLPDADALVQALHRLQALPSEQRPLLLQHWSVVALDHSGGRRLGDSAADALRLTGTLLDCPLTPELARHYSGFLQEQTP